jgi:hypothetical protein
VRVIGVLSFKWVVVWGSLRSGSGLLGINHGGHGEHGVEEEVLNYFKEGK